MLTDPLDPSRVLIEPADLGGEDPLVRRHAEPLGRVVAWAREYLCRPHPELGRKGPVCPYAQTSLDKAAFYLAVCPGRPDVARATSVLAGYRDWFGRLESPPEVLAQFRTILVLFPEIEDIGVIDAAQIALKTDYVRDGLMIGEFHDGPPRKAGLWNPAFLPLRSPVPMLVVRHMVGTDLPFLQGDPDHEAAYHERFGDRRVRR
ncbi:DUF6875 domain-containing protein [Thermoactinospora rubra]|uniref:DUF6875 domain-containing protein n=1 Tax=Thermoactinospora rubra TaxID=1088767 RepID=UPI000A117186|nr:hypothetical protein [Thermoactinospora rubra]